MKRPFSQRIGISAIPMLALTGSVALLPRVDAEATTPSLYTITDLGSLPGDLSVAKGINNAGVVVGYSAPEFNVTHAFRWTKGNLVDLGTLPDPDFSQADAINDAGQVAGSVGRPNGGFSQPARWSATNVLQPLGGPILNALGWGHGIDALGRVVGGQRPGDESGNPYGARYDLDGKMTFLADPPNGLSIANGANPQGQIVGDGYIWDNGKVTFLKGLDSTHPAFDTMAINVGGTAVGASYDSTSVSFGKIPVVWRNGVLISTFQSLSGLPYARANAINAAGQTLVTADSYDCLDVFCSESPTARALIGQVGSPKLTFLDDLIPAGSGWTLQEPNGINDRGQIVGRGIHNGHPRAFLLTPRFSATVNFGPAGSTVPVGYSLDSGAVYGARAGGLSYGWNIDNSTWTRDRNSASSPDQRYDTLIHLQKPGSASKWELAVPNGKYVVHTVSGDSCCTDSTFRINVEGTLAATGAPTATKHWIEGTATVTVSDGRLTITNASGASNNKLNYVDVIAAS
jgi:probable HAF family extracellular repeat protein